MIHDSRMRLGKTFLRIGFTFAILTVAFFARAEIFPIDPPTSARSFEALLLGILNYLTPFAFTLAAAFIIFSGFKYILALGNPTKIAAANKTLTYVLIGTALIVGAAAIAGAVINTIKQIR